MGQLCNTEGQEGKRPQILLKQRQFKELGKLYWKFKLVQCAGHYISTFTKSCGGLLGNKFKHKHIAHLIQSWTCFFARNHKFWLIISMRGRRYYFWSLERESSFPAIIPEASSRAWTITYFYQSSAKDTASFFFPANGWHFGSLINAVAFALVTLESVQVKGTEFNELHCTAHWHFDGKLQEYLLCQNLLSLIDWAQPASSGRWEEDHKQYLPPVQDISIKKQKRNSYVDLKSYGIK